MVRALSTTLLFAFAGCGAVQQKFEAGRSFAQAIKPGHSYQAFSMPSESMMPTVRVNDQMLVDKSTYESSAVQRGDIIVFAPPVPSTNPFVKRVIALPGDTLSIRHGTIRVNGRPLPPSVPTLHPMYDVAVSSYRITVDGEPLLAAFADVPPRPRWTAPDRLPPGCYFLLGDNVDNSEDSHVWGCAELSGTFSAGPRKGEHTALAGKVVKIFRL